MIKLKELIKEKCNCGKICCSVTEEVKHISKAKKKLQKLMKDESILRGTMHQIALIMSKDIVNNDLADNIMKSYKINVTGFMKEAIKLVKKVK